MMAYLLSESHGNPIRPFNWHSPPNMQKHSINTVILHIIFFMESGYDMKLPFIVSKIMPLNWKQKKRSFDMIWNREMKLKIGNEMSGREKNFTFTFFCGVWQDLGVMFYITTHLTHVWLRSMVFKHSVSFEAYFSVIVDDRKNSTTKQTPQKWLNQWQEALRKFQVLSWIKQTFLKGLIKMAIHH